MKNPVYVADFETTTDPNDCRVWGWGMCEVSLDAEAEDVEVGGNIDSFFARIESSNSVVWFHNLRFDGRFILDRILREGYEHVGDYARVGEFQTLISHDNNFYSITVRWRAGGRTEFRDSLKKFPGMSVDRISKTFNLPMHKLSIDYKAYRAPDHEPTEHEREYIAADVAIVARALALQLNQGMNKLTVGADSLSEFKKLFGSKMFRRTFPLLSHSMDADIRKAYRGGWTYCDPRFQGRRTGKGAVYDVNSLYPFVMYSRLLPYGLPMFFEGFPEERNDYPLFVVSITFTAKLRPGHLPCIQVKGSSKFLATEYLEEVSEPITLSITNIDLDLWNEHYELEILAYNGGWYFRAAQGFFDDYINKWMQVKKTSEGGMREIAKLHLNSLYGKFATNPNVTGKVPTLVENAVALKMGPEEIRDPVYTAMGVFITSYARDITIRAAQANYDVFAYADTDSIHVLTWDDPVGVEVNPDELGAWKREYYFDDALFYRAKTYAELKTDGETEVHMAGLPRGVAKTIRIDDIVPGASWGPKLMHKVVPGGVVLEETTFTLDRLLKTV